MTAYARHWLECDICEDDDEHTVSGDRLDAKDARDHARAGGWRRQKVDGKMVDVCPDCVRRRALKP